MNRAVRIHAYGGPEAVGQPLTQAVLSDRQLAGTAFNALHAAFVAHQLPRLQAWYRRSDKSFWKLIVVKAAMWRRLHALNVRAQSLHGHMMRSTLGPST